MKFSNKILSQIVTQLCLANDIRHVVISPGSRNAPLTIGFTSQKEFVNYSIVDERCAAFFALGIAQQLKKPVALVCTSGSALLNYFPAIAEAYYSDISLVVISADRPASHIEIGDGQTIQQEDVYGKHILYNANCIEGDEHAQRNSEEINTALQIAMIQKGPVHINIPFSEPLYETDRALAHLPAVQKIENTLACADEDEIQKFKNLWHSHSKKMILVGVLSPNSIEQAVVDMLAEDESVIVLTETTSNLHHKNFFPSIDQLIAPLTKDEFSALQPEVLLTLGGMVVSKKIKAFLREFSPKHHWHIDSKKAYDTYFVLDKHVISPPNDFLKSFLSGHEMVQSNYRKTWLEVKHLRLKKHKEYLSHIVHSDFLVFSEVFASIPKNIQLQLSNSATIRYAQLFDIQESIRVFCNRGTSGIDGSTSTSVGAAVASKEQTVLVTGDISFFYDSNALWNDYIPSNFRIILVNNSGGGIFRILKGAKEHDHFETYFETRHNLNAEDLCKMFKFKYEKASNQLELKTKLNGFFDASEEPKLLEIFTPPTVNDTILLDYFKFIKS